MRKWRIRVKVIYDYDISEGSLDRAQIKALEMAIKANPNQDVWLESCTEIK